MVKPVVIEEFNGKHKARMSGKEFPSFKELKDHLKESINVSKYLEDGFRIQRIPLRLQEGVRGLTASKG